MGTLQNIRKISPYVFGIFAFLLVAFFTIGDPTIIDGLRGAAGSPTSQVLGKVNGEEILYMDYETRVREEEENQRRQMEQQGQEPVIDNNQVRQRVWDGMVEEILLKQQAQDLGVLVTDQKVKEQMIDNPPDFLKKMFSDSAGKFNRELYLDLITNPENYAKYLGDPNKVPLEQRQEAVAKFREDLIRIEKYIRQTMQQKELQEAVALSKAIISPNFTKLQYKNENSTANVNFIAVSVRDIPQDAMNIPKEEIEKYYNENKQYFKQKAQRRIKYIAIPIKPSAEDSAKAQKRIDNIKSSLESVMTDAEKDSIFEIKLSEYSGTTYDYKIVSDIDPQVMGFIQNLQNRQVVGPIYRPDGVLFYRLDDKRSGENVVVKASHILINFNNNKDSAKLEADKIMAEVKSGKTPFAILATKYSQDQGSARNGGDVGFFGKGRMVKPFEDAAFAANVGDIVGPVETQFGYHIIKVDDKKTDDLKYSEIKISPSVSQATKSKILRDAKSIEQQLKDGANIDSVASKLKLRSAESPFFAENTPVLGSRYLSALSFMNNVGTSLEPLELERYGVIIPQVSAAKQAGLSSLEDVRIEISQKLGKLKQLDAAKKRITEIYNQVKGSSSLSNLLQDSSWAKQIKNIPDFKYSASVTGIGQDAAFAPKVFSMPLNKISEPVRGENAYFIIEVLSKQEPNEDTIKKSLGDYMQQLQLQAKNNVFYEWFQSVKDQAKIEDFRAKFYKDF